MELYSKYGERGKTNVVIFHLLYRVLGGLYFTHIGQGKALWGPIGEFGKYFIILPTNGQSTRSRNTIVLRCKMKYKKYSKVLRGPGT